MAGIDDNVAIMGEFVAPTPSSRTLLTAVLGDDKSSKPILDREPSFTNGKTEGFFQGSQGQIGVGNVDKKDFSQLGFQLTEEKLSSKGGLGERIAARAGFNAPRLNTENIRSADFSFNPDILSPCLTISSPGLSPATLLESPVFLTNPFVQPSPTTGKFPFMPNGNNNRLFSGPPDKSKDEFFEDIHTSFAFPTVSRPSSSFFSAATSKVAVLSHQSLHNIEVSVESENSLKSQTIEPVKPISENKGRAYLEAGFPGSSTEKNNLSNTEHIDQRIFDSANASADPSPPLDDPQDEEQRGSVGDLVAGDAPAEDGYNWRKYGQKQVKGSEYPRSYYKCTYPNCQVKKKVERSREGHITEIIYKGAHNHPKPPPNRRSAIGLSFPSVDMQLDVPEQAEPQNTMGRNSVWASTQQVGTAGTPDNVEVTSATSAGLEYGNPTGSFHVQSGTQFESGEVVDASSTFSNDEDEDEDDHGTHGSVSLGCDGEEDESESKRRKLEVYATEMSGATRAIREPRVVVQTTSDVDILDDGYRWRKYGQKVVKGNPNPRSYYKCTAPGCTVRKHVERASHDLKSVITTYEGKHNHDVPAARNSSSGGSGGSANHQHATASATQTQVHQPEPGNRFERPLSMNASFGGPFSFQHQLGHSQGLCFGMNQQGIVNLGLPRLGFGQGKLPVLPVHPYLAQQALVSDVRFAMQKGDTKVEPISEPGLSSSNDSAIYRQIMSRLPLGPPM